MKATISSRPNKSLIKYPCLMIHKEYREEVVLMVNMGKFFRATVLSGEALGDTVEYSKRELEEGYEVFTGSLTMENN